MPIFAPRTYSPGDAIHSEVPFVWVLPHSLRDQLCQSCCRSGFNLRHCKQCAVVKYCGRACQKKDWRLHGLECKQMVHLPDKDNYDLVRLVGRVILKIKGKNWRHFKTSLLGAEVSFEEIDPHYKEMTENPYLNLMYKEAKEDVKRFVGAENMPTDIDCLKIVGKVVSNTYTNTNGITTSLCFFIGTSQFEAECIANSSFAVSSGGLKIWASKAIKKGSDKITISKKRFFGGGGMSPLSLLEAIKNEPCKCTDCSLPYGEAVLSKILDEKNAFSTIKVTQSVLKMIDILPRVMSIELEEHVDDVLEKHFGVLGRTNLMHLKLMTFRYLDIGGHARDIKDKLEDLETNMRSVFGEFYYEMLQIYKNLSLVHLHLGDVFRWRMYFEKIEKLENFMRPA